MNWRWHLAKKSIVCKLGDLGEARAMYTHTDNITCKKRANSIHREA